MGIERAKKKISKLFCTKFHEKSFRSSQFIALLQAEEMTDRWTEGTVLVDNLQGC